MTQDLQIGWLHLSPPRDACFIRHVYSLQQQNSYNSQKIISIISLTKKSTHFMVGWDSIIGIATSSGLDSPGIESQWGARFFAPVQTSPGAHPASCTMGTGSLSWGRVAGVLH